jgi:RNA polymerase sigma factor (sigma-70 family)
VKDAVARGLRALPPRQRAAIVLRYYENRDDAAIADLLGCAPATVRSLLARGRHTLRHELDPFVGAGHEGDNG